VKDNGNRSRRLHSDVTGIQGTHEMSCATSNAELRNGQQHVERLRELELGAIQQYFASGSSVLEIGGGTGFQAGLIASRGCHVVSIDIAPPTSDVEIHFPIKVYDGYSIPCYDAEFDVVFSSNVLEHVKNIKVLLNETRRCLKAGGLAIHVLPSPAWRFWTSMSHYAYVVLRILGLRSSVPGGTVLSAKDKVRSSGLWYVIRRAIWAGPHGEYPNALTEIYYFSKMRWLKVFRDSGFEVVQVMPSGVFYTGYGVFRNLSLRSRQRMARLIGSATYIYVLRKN
jgi:2-polyprenyl-3-methyl-5-hydroxy-6-metoxy-1,4-benzoquinol methylase